MLGSGVSHGESISEGLAPLGGGSGRLGRFRGAGSLLVQAGGKLSTTADLTSSEFGSNPAAGLARLTMIAEDLNWERWRRSEWTPADRLSNRGWHDVWSPTNGRSATAAAYRIFDRQVPQEQIPDAAQVERNTVSNPKVRAAFNQQVVVLPIQSIVAQREILPSYRKSPIYLQISASLERVGLIEPLVVFPKGHNEYLLLDGHVRLDILKRTGATEVRAIFATDDEAYTYNKRVNHAPPVAQHFLILKALKNGVSEERIATALNVNVGSIRKKRDMLDGICPEAVEILRNSHMTADALPC
jgi:RepB plasmid partitioning protein/ParB-like nuclease domain